MESYILARVIHVIGVVLWIGGVAMVTTVILPSIMKMESSVEQMAMFEKLESRFAMQAKITTVLTGISGFYMLHYLNAWHRYAELKFWWVHAMTLIWLIFTLVLFVLEPLFLHQLFRQRALQDPVKAFTLVHRLHWLLLLLSLLTVAAAVAGSHGWFWF